MQEEESNIIRGIREGREHSYAQLFESYYSILTIFACKYVHDLDTAREIVQDLFVHIYDHRNSLLITSSLKTYLYQSVRNRCLNYLKHRKVQEKVKDHIIADSQGHDDPETMFHETELEHHVFKIVESLPPRCRQIFKLSRIEGKKNIEIARSLGISIRTVETQISKALRILRKNLRVLDRK